MVGVTFGVGLIVGRAVGDGVTGVVVGNGVADGPTVDVGATTSAAVGIVVGDSTGMGDENSITIGVLDGGTPLANSPP
jgi:hypothetical protein